MRSLADLSDRGTATSTPGCASDPQQDDAVARGEDHRADGAAVVHGGVLGAPELSVAPAESDHLRRRRGVVDRDPVLEITPVDGPPNLLVGTERLAQVAAPTDAHASVVFVKPPAALDRVPVPV